MKSHAAFCAAEPGATFRVLDSKRKAVYSAGGSLLGTWSHSHTLTYRIYALDFTVPGCDTYSISVSGPLPAASPGFRSILRLRSIRVCS